MVALWRPSFLRVPSRSPEGEGRRSVGVEAPNRHRCVHSVRSYRERVDKTLALVEKSAILDDEHIQFTILRACLGSCKLVYTLRGVCPSPMVLQTLEKFDDLLLLALERLSKAGLSDAAWSQSSLSSSDGGLGLRHACHVAEPAFLGSVADTAALVAKILGRDAVVIPRVQEASSSFLERIRALPSSPVSSKLAVLAGALDQDSLLVFSKKPQAELQEAADKSLWQDLFGGSAANDRDRLEAITRLHAGAWLSAFPRKALGLWIPGDQFVVGLQLWLGTAKASDVRALRVAGAGMHGRHHAIRDVIYEAAKSAALRPWNEASVDSSGRRPADIFLPSFSHGRPLCVDVTISHPSQSTLSLQAREGVSASEQAAVDKFVQKEREYKELCASSGAEFLPLPVCAFGGLLGSSEDLLGTLAARLSEHTGLNRSVTSSQLWQRISVRLWAGNAKMVLQKRGPATGHWFNVAQRM